MTTKPPAESAPAGLRQIPAGVWTLGFVSMLMDLSSEMIHSLLPLFMFTTLGASAFTIGLIEGLAEATALIVKVFSGALSDFLGKRKGLAVFGYAQSNERVSELLRNLANNTAWLERPDLTEIRSVTLGPQGLGLSPVASAAATRDTKTVYEFTLSALIKSPSAVDSAAAKKTTSLTATPVAAASPAAR